MNDQVSPVGISSGTRFRTRNFKGLMEQKYTTPSAEFPRRPSSDAGMNDSVSEHSATTILSETGPDGRTKTWKQRLKKPLRWLKTTQSTESAAHSHSSGTTGPASVAGTVGAAATNLKNMLIPSRASNEKPMSQARILFEKQRDLSPLGIAVVQLRGVRRSNGKPDRGEPDSTMVEPSNMKSGKYLRCVVKYNGKDAVAGPHKADAADQWSDVLVFPLNPKSSRMSLALWIITDHGGSDADAILAGSNAIRLRNLMPGLEDQSQPCESSGSVWLPIRLHQYGDRPARSRSYEVHIDYSIVASSKADLLKKWKADNDAAFQLLKCVHAVRDSESALRPSTQQVGRRFFEKTFFVNELVKWLRDHGCASSDKEGFELAQWLQDIEAINAVLEPYEQVSSGSILCRFSPKEHVCIGNGSLKSSDSRPEEADTALLSRLHTDFDDSEHPPLAAVGFAGGLQPHDPPADAITRAELDAVIRDVPSRSEIDNLTKAVRSLKSSVDDLRGKVLQHDEEATSLRSLIDYESSQRRLLTENIRRFERDILMRLDQHDQDRVHSVNSLQQIFDEMSDRIQSRFTSISNEFESVRRSNTRYQQMSNNIDQKVNGVSVYVRQHTGKLQRLEERVGTIEEDRKPGRLKCMAIKYSGIVLTWILSIVALFYGLYARLRGRKLDEDARISVANRLRKIREQTLPWNSRSDRSSSDVKDGDKQEGGEEQRGLSKGDSDTDLVTRTKVLDELRNRFHSTKHTRVKAAAPDDVKFLDRVEEVSTVDHSASARTSVDASGTSTPSVAFSTADLSKQFDKLVSPTSTKPFAGFGTDTVSSSMNANASQVRDQPSNDAHGGDFSGESLLLASLPSSGLRSMLRRTGRN